MTAGTASDCSGRWPFPVLAFYMDKATAATLQSAINRGGIQDREGQLCEADAYLGEWRLAHGDAIGARQCFDAASAECPVDFFEKIEARRKLARMAEGVKKSRGFAMGGWLYALAVARDSSFPARSEWPLRW